jgi:hypothetical protein
LVSTALQNLATTTGLLIPTFLQGAVSVSQSDPIQVDDYIGELQGEVLTDDGDAIIDMAGESTAEELGFETPSIGTLLGNPEINLAKTWIGLQANSINLAATDVCELEGATEIVEVRIRVGILKVVLPTCQYAQVHVPVNVFPPNPNLTVNVTSSQGTPVGPDSLQFISSDDLGFGFPAQVGSQGTATIPVPADNYTVRAGAVGFTPTIQTVSVPTGSSTLNLTLNMPSSQQIGLNGANITYSGASVLCTSTGAGGFFDNCTGTVSLNIGVPIENGNVAVTMDQLMFDGGNPNPYSVGAVPGPVTFPISGGILQGTCSAGAINTDIQVEDGGVTIGSSSSVPLTISCGPGS